MKEKEKEKKTWVNPFADIMTVLIFLIFGAFIGWVVYLIYNPETRIYIISFIVFSWIITIWEIYKIRVPKSSKKQEAK